MVLSPSHGQPRGCTSRTLGYPAPDPNAARTRLSTQWSPRWLPTGRIQFSVPDFVAGCRTVSPSRTSGPAGRSHRMGRSIIERFEFPPRLEPWSPALYPCGVHWSRPIPEGKAVGSSRIMLRVIPDRSAGRRIEGGMNLPRAWRLFVSWWKRTKDHRTSPISAKVHVRDAFI